MDWMTPLGYIIGLGTVGWVLIRGNSVGLIFNLHAIVLVYGGTLGATLLSYPSSVHLSSHSVGAYFPFSGHDVPRRPRSSKLLSAWPIKRAAKASKALKPDVTQIQIPFLAMGLRMVLDGLPVEIVRGNLIKEIRFARDRHAQVSNVFRSAASYAPIFGLLGTLVGVVQVLVTLSDPKTIGASMAVAMTATFYGIFGANFLFLPVAGKLNVYAQEEVFLAELMIEGILCIQQNEVPALALRKLQFFAEAHKRNQIEAPGGTAPTRRAA